MDLLTSACVRYGKLNELTFVHFMKNSKVVAVIFWKGVIGFCAIRFTYYILERFDLCKKPICYNPIQRSCGHQTGLILYPFMPQVAEQSQFYKILGAPIF